MLTFTDDQLRAKVKADLGADASAIDFLPFSNVEQSVIDDVKELKASPLLMPGLPVTGCVYDVRSGKVTVVA
jgi:carbonic anhydrase